MTKPQEILTPSLPEFCEKIIKLAQQGYSMHRDPEMLSWQYYCEMVKGVTPEVVVAVSDEASHNPIPMPSPGRKGAKPKVKAAHEEAEPAKEAVKE